MTTDGPLGERPANAPPRAAPQLLDVCDRLLGEVGRRRHLFGWLRTPDAESWVPVDAYYPGNRLVVLCRDDASAGDELIDARVPEHGLRLLRLKPAVVEADPAGVVGALERHLGALAPAPPRPRPMASPSPVARAVASLGQPRTAPETAHHRAGPAQAEAVARATRFVAAHPVPAAARRTSAPVERRLRLPPARARRVARTRRRQADLAARVSVPLAAALVAALVAEVYFGVIRWALDGGHLLLAFGLSLDTCARALGTVAAGRAADRSGAWWCALGGTPFVAGFALYGADGPVEVDPAPLAGLLALFAAVVLAIAVLVAALGGG